MQKRAQVQSQVFVYIMILIVIGATVLFGYDAIQKLAKQGKETQVEQFKAQLKSDITEIAPNYGSVKVKTYRVGAASQLCFGVSGGVKSCDSPSQASMIRSALGSDSANAFLTGQGFDAFSAGNINLAGCEIKCYPVKRGYVALKLTGMGDKTLVESG